jgi:hypothetical protein
MSGTETCDSVEALDEEEEEEETAAFSIDALEELRCCIAKSWFCASASACVRCSNTCKHACSRSRARATMVVTGADENRDEAERVSEDAASGAAVTWLRCECTASKNTRSAPHRRSAAFKNGSSDA